MFEELKSVLDQKSKDQTAQQMAAKKEAVIWIKENLNRYTIFELAKQKIELNDGIIANDLEVRFEINEPKNMHVYRYLGSTDEEYKNEDVGKLIDSLQSFGIEIGTRAYYNQNDWAVRLITFSIKRVSKN